MTKSRTWALGILLAAISTARAEVTVTPAVVSDYDLRGISQSARDPALQLGVNYSHPSGFYAGMWGSNVDFGHGDPKGEADLSSGFRFGDPKDGFAYDLGANYYSYVSASDLNYPEIYAGMSRGWFSAKLYYSWDFHGTKQSAWYVSTAGTLAVGQGFTALAHAGYSGGNYWDKFYGDGYFDWSVGVAKSVGNFTLGLSFVDGSDLPSGPSRIFSTKGRVVGSVSTRLPWSAE